MSESNRVARWRERLRQEGKKAVTVWLTTTEEQRLKDLAATWHCSPSELVQQALAQFHPGRPPGISNDTETQQMSIGNDTDMSQIQVWLQAELPGMVRQIVEQLAVEMLTETVADAFDDIEDEELPCAADITAADTVTDTRDSDATDDAQMQIRGVTDTAAPTQPHAVQPADAATPTYDTARYYLGKLCPRQHAYQDTAQSLRYRGSKRCIACDTEDAQARRDARKRQQARSSQ